MVLFNGVAQKFLDTSAYNLLNRFAKNDMDLPSPIKSLCVKEFVFKLILSNYKLKEGLKNNTVSKVYQPDKHLELQYRISKAKKMTCPTTIHIIVHISFIHTS